MTDNHNRYITYLYTHDYTREITMTDALQGRTIRHYKLSIRFEFIEPQEYDEVYNTTITASTTEEACRKAKSIITDEVIERAIQYTKINVIGTLYLDYMWKDNEIAIETFKYYITTKDEPIV